MKKQCQPLFTSKRSKVLPLVLFLSLAGAASGASSLDGEFWREHGLNELIPLWHAHVLDEEYGGYHQNLNREWEVTGPHTRIPAMMSRQVFAFTAAFLMSGDDRYLEAARHGVDWLLARAWDKEYGGWYGEVHRDGTVVLDAKRVPVQLYSNVGLSLFWMATGDDRVLEHVNRSLEIRRTAGHDETYGGYYQELNRNLSAKDPGKNKHAHYGYVGSLTLNHFLATRDPDVLAFSRELCDLSLDRQREGGWLFGFRSLLDRQWRRTPNRVNGKEAVEIGAQLTGALALLRLHHQSGEQRYYEAGKELAERINAHGFDADRGCFIDRVTFEPPHAPLAADGQSPRIHAWIQFYGAFLQLQLYNLTGDPACLERFEKAEAFYLEHMIDREHGGVFPQVSREGERSGKPIKAGPWNTAYHQMEHSLLNYLYLNLYVNGRPATLHFRLDGGPDGRVHALSPVDDRRVRLESVHLNGRPWRRFDPEARTIDLPPGKDLRVEARLAPVPGRAR